MKVSIITATFNSDKTIMDTLMSVKNQSYKNIEHIIIDGKSSDNTFQIIKSFDSKNIKVISEKDDGIYDAMNKGLNIASGDIVGLLNSDDFFSSNLSIEYVINAFSRNDIDACYGDLAYVNKENNKIIRYWKSEDFFHGKFGKGWAPPHPTFYIKTRALGDNRFNLKYSISADIELMSRLMEVQKIKTSYIPKTLVRMRVGGASNGSFKSIILQNFEVIRSFNANNIRYNLPLFVIKKLFNRLGQYIFALKKNKELK